MCGTFLHDLEGLSFVSRKHNFKRLELLFFSLYINQCYLYVFFQESKRAIVVPARVEPLHLQFWGDNRILVDLPTLDGARDRVKQSLSHVRQDHMRYLNPTPYKVNIIVLSSRRWNRCTLKRIVNY